MRLPFDSCSILVSRRVIRMAFLPGRAWNSRWWPVIRSDVSRQSSRWMCNWGNQRLNVWKCEKMDSPLLKEYCRLYMCFEIPWTLPSPMTEDMH